MIVPNGSGANSIPTSSGATSESVRFPVSNSIHVSVELGFLVRPERLAVERGGAFAVAGRHGDEVGALHLNHSARTSGGE
jgi:hypothetical protein